MKPTAIFGETANKSLVVPRDTEVTPVTTTALVIPASFPVTLTAEETSAITARILKADIAMIPLRDIAMMESQPEIELQRILDQFLSRIDQFDNPQLYVLFKKLGEAVDEQRLPQLAEQILDAKPTFLERVSMMFSSAKARQAAMSKVWDAARERARGSTTTLVTLIKHMETDLAVEQAKLDREIGSMEQLKDAYRDRFRDFAVSTAFMQAFLAKARDDVAREEQQMDPNDPIQKARIDELHGKLQAIESRALTLEGTLTRLPADQLVIRQLQEAGIATLQETTTTAMQRFGSIKMTLITLNGALVTRNVQRLAEQGAALDHNLLAVRSAVMKDVVTTSANAPGDNRLAQANSLKQIVSDTKELQGIVETARVTNAQKFDQARTLFTQARQDLLGLGQKILPGAPIRY